jgi:diguanylate cyclase (GGDEF)-like protein
VNIKHFEELRYCVNLPSPAGVGIAVLRLTTCDDPPVDELVSMLRFDPSLTARLLRVVNSAATARQEPASTVEQAAARIHASVVQDVALGFGLVPGSQIEGRASFDHDTYWSFSIACALAASHLARRKACVDPGLAFTAGLLSRIGMLALATIHAEAYERLLSEANGQPPEHLLAEEARQFDIQHWEVAAAMLTECRLDESVITAILAQGDARAFASEESAASDPLGSILAEAGLIARALLCTEAAGTGRAARTLELLCAACHCAVDEAQLASTCSELRPLWADACRRMRANEPAAAVPEAQVGGAGGAGSRASAPAAALPGRRTNSVVAAIAPQDMEILVADDDPGILRQLGAQLRQAGYSVRTACDGEEALRAAADQPPHLLVTDWMMPRMSGLDLVRELRRTDFGRGIYVLVLTSRSLDDQVVTVFDSGADEFVAKPFNPRILQARVLAGHRMIELQRQVEADRQSQALQVMEMGLLTRRLEVAAYTDVLTELPNRRYAIERLDREWSDARRLGRPLSVLAVDIDHFKQVNDRCGHDVGDLVLRSTAGVLRAHTRKADQVCRMGGEEFLVINSNSTCESALVCAERLRRAVEGHVVRQGTATNRVTVSIGVASVGPGVESVHALLKAADEAVYEAKAAGRNAVRLSRRVEGGRS